MSGKEWIVDPSEVDLNHVVADIETIRRFNAQRFEFEQLTAVVHEDVERRICVAYKDQTEQEFWVRGHMPGKPLLPGVLMCESAAQLCSYFSSRHDLLGARLMGFGGMDEVRFREPVRPGQRLVVAIQIEKIRRGAIVVCRFQEFVGGNLVCEGIVRGVPLPVA